MSTTLDWAQEAWDKTVHKVAKRAKESEIASRMPV